MDNLEVHLSNRVEALYEILKEQLFSEGSHPFTKRCIIVPSPAMKLWLTQRLADDLGIASGIQIDHLETGLKKITALVTPSDLRIPGNLELAFAIESALRDLIVERRSLPDLSLWQPLFSHLKISDAAPTLSRKGEKRLIALAAQLAQDFGQYGKYGNAMVRRWRNRPPEHWQEALWQQLFRKERYQYPYQVLEHLAVPQQEHREIHIFAISYLSQLQHALMRHLSVYFPLRYYLLSPCQAQWSYVRSDKEAHALRQFWKRQQVDAGQIETLEEQLRERNPLLANLGRLGREMAEQVEKSDALTEEHYALPSAVADHEPYRQFLFEEPLSSNHPLTLLEALQADMLLMRTPDENERIALGHDGTVQVHVSSNRLREVENLYDTLLRLVAEKGVSPGETVVMAPDIMEYEPYIKSVFGRQQSVLPFKIMDLRIPSQSIFIQAFLHMLALAKGRWNTEDLLQLLDYAPLRAKQGFSYEDAQLIRGWICNSGIRWGYDAEDRNVRLQRDHFRTGMSDNSDAGTWSFGFSQLLNGIVRNLPEAPTHRQTEQLDTTQSALLGKWIRLVESLRSDLDLLNNGTKALISEWSNYLEDITDTYLKAETPQQEADRQLLFGHLEKIRRAGAAAGMQRFPFATVEKHVQESLNREETCFQENILNGVRFCSMLPMRALPAQVIVLLGMQEGEFPKKDLRSPLNLMDSAECDYCPSQTDYDRYLFLETLLSARRYFLISYQGNADTSPSLLVSELLSYINEAYTISSSSCILHHPHLSFDPSYFTAESAFKSYSMQRYEAALSWLASGKEQRKGFIDSFAIRIEAPEPPDVVDLKELESIAKNPVKHYFNKTLGLYIAKEDDHLIKTEEDFSLSPLEHGTLRKAALLHDFDVVANYAEQLGLLPFGVFKKMALAKLKQDFDGIKGNMRAFSVRSDDLATIHLSPHHRQPEQKGKNVWYVPALQIGRTTVTGTINHASPQGLVAYVNNSADDVFSCWPTILALGVVIAQNPVPAGASLLPVKGDFKDARAPMPDPETMLKRYLDYYNLAKSTPSPLIPQWIPPILNRDRKKIFEHLRNKHFYQDEIKWAVSFSELSDTDSIFDHWQEIAEANFAEAHQLWFEKKGKK